ncbi:outer membrane lipid asymmetry maintenance protein MlaD [Candidatus Berkiella aquae]|uniref:Outer membrane lipid asymmetry maintenance protein MlaD n=1 Tax=Candidatus Berkiella aquae TaxID=295108 RepID=A0A0Q9YUR2_9GAMM|nr:outer membrane lipid asymmetry maintenance protein MlaD [Candidatus Berkiella aquae]MCS5710735.1 outer membrane lipid asymmetry maintenance protein MlaD [Candidatus Berkiella aquae]
MQKRTVEIAVGFFFLLGILAFSMLAIQVSGLTKFYNVEKGYNITADFENIGGLKPRARVTIAGVAVGRVVAINYDPKDYVARVSILVDNKVNNIPDDTTASILTSGLLGDNYIGLTPGFSETYYKEGDHIPVENTSKAVVLEELVSKFLSSQASGLK